MKKIFNKINFLVGIILVVPFWLIGKMAENLARLLLGILQKFFYAIDWLGVSGGYAAMFYEKLIMEAVGSFSFCFVMICGPIFLNKKFFPNFKINWVPAIILTFIYFSYYGLLILIMFFKAIGKMDWIDTISFLVMSIGFFGGYIGAIITAATYSNIKHPLIEKFK
jgi:hypothetical protein